MSHAEPALTFVVAAHNAADTLPQTLGAFQAQTRPDWNAVVVDDASTDETAAVARALGDPRIRVVRSPARGVASARNFGLAIASSPLVCVTDADDVHDDRFFEVLAGAIGGHDLVACGFRYAGPDLQDAGWAHSPTDADAHAPALLELNQFALGAIMARRDALRSLARGDGVFAPGTHVEDWDLLVRADEAGLRWAPVVASPLFTYRLRPSSRTTGLRALWLDGLSLIRARTPDRACAARWTLRSLARAAVMRDEHLTRECLEWLQGLTPEHTDILAGALRFAMRRSETAREPGVPSSPTDWEARLPGALGDGPVARDAVRRALHSRRRWRDVAQAAVARLAPGQTLAIYGLGRNGREVLEALPADGVAYVCVDDAGAAAGTPAAAARRMIRREDLGPGHVVLVTPDDRSSILRRLREQPVAGVLLPEDLAA